MKLEGFHTLLNKVMDTEGLKAPGLKKLLNEKDFELSKRSIYRYMTGETVPSFKVARAICDVLLIEDISDKDIEEMLNITRLQTNYNLTRRMKNKTEMFDKRITFPLEEIGKELGLEKDECHQVLEIIRDRIKEVYPGDKVSYSNYVKDLIQNDIVNDVLEVKTKGDRNNG